MSELTALFLASLIAAVLLYLNFRRGWLDGVAKVFLEIVVAIFFAAIALYATGTVKSWELFVSACMVYALSVSIYRLIKYLTYREARID